MIRAIRLYVLRRRMERANAEYVAYQTRPAMMGWSWVVADGLRRHLIATERAYSRALNA